MGVPFRIGLKDAAILALTRGRYTRGLLAHVLRLAPSVAAVGAGAAVGIGFVRHLPGILPLLGGPAADGIRNLASVLAARNGTPLEPVFAGVLVLWTLQAVLAGTLAVGFLAALLLLVLPLSAGSSDWYRLNRSGLDAPFRTLFSFFRAGRYGIAVRTFALQTLRIAPCFLPAAVVAVAASMFVALRYATEPAWLQGAPVLPVDSFAGLALPVLLAILAVAAGLIPVWIRNYAFRPIPWILAALPGLAPREVVRLSERMTRGRRLDLFLLDLSFAGWAVSSLLVCGTGFLFLAPYYEAVQAEAHARLAEEAEAEGFLVRRARSSRTDPEASRTGSP